MTRNKILPFILSAVIIALDQITKMVIVKTINPYTVGVSFFGDFFRIIHVRNKAIAFSMGHSLPDNLRTALFSFLPLIILVVLIVYIIRNNEISSFQRWVAAGIIGGGFGNLIDRFFRPAGVVDFLDVKFYGLFGLERWPTFNVADSVVVVCGSLLFISMLFPRVGKPVESDSAARMEKSKTESDNSKVGETEK